MLSQEIIIRRLALIKQLYKIGLEHSKQVDTIACFSILAFHDSIEMFLKLIAENKSIKSDTFNFLDYWNSFPNLTLKESMRNLNARRVNIKHKGLLPSKADIEVSRVNTTDFFEQNVFPQLGINFNEISLLTLISYDTVRGYLEEAQTALNELKIELCIEKVGIAFNELLHVYEQNKVRWGTSPFFFGRDLTFNSAFFMGIQDRKLAEFIDKVKESLDGIQSAVKIISFGIDYKRYVKFKLLTPHVTRTLGGIHISEIWREKKWTKDNCQFCIDFVLDSALKLQEFDFDISEIEEQEDIELLIKSNPDINPE